MIINRTDHHKKISHVGLIASSGLKTVKKTKLCGWGHFSSRSILNGLRSSEITKKNTPNFFKLWKNYPGYKCLWVSVFNSLCKQDKYGEKTCCITFGFFFGNTNILKCYCFWTFCRINRNAALGETKQKRKKLEQNTYTLYHPNKTQLFTSFLVYFWEVIPAFD